MKNNKGIALVVALVMTLLVMIIGTTAIKMSEIGYLTYGSERNYQMAEMSAEYGMNHVINGIKTTALSCGATPSGTTTSGGTYSAVTVNGGGFCFVRSVGQSRGAKVVKVSVMPTAGTNWAAVYMNNGGSVSLGGNSSISSCTSTCQGPAIINGGILSTSFTGAAGTPSCSKLNGIVGNPNTQNSSQKTVDEMVALYFATSTLSDLKTALGTKYGVDVSSLTSTGVDPGCQISSSCTMAYSSGNWSCGSTNVTSCNKIYGSAGATITISGNDVLSNKTIVSAGTVTISMNGNGTLTNTNIITNDLNIMSVGNTAFTGDLIYVADTLRVDTKAYVGTAANPYLFLVNNIDVASTGNPEIYGFSFVTGTGTLGAGGTFDNYGSLVFANPSSSPSISLQGTPNIRFNHTVINNLAGKLGSSILGSVNCNDINPNTYITSNMVTVY